MPAFRLFRPLPCALSALVIAASACSDPAAPVPGAVLNVTVDSSAGPIIRTVTVTMDQPAPAEVVYAAPGTPVLRLVADSQTTVHRFTLPRLRASRSYTVEAAVPGGTSAPRTVSFGTAALPADVAEIVLQATGTPTLPVSIIDIAGSTRYTGMIIVEDGEIVGYQRITGSLFGSTRRRNGNRVLLESIGGLIEFRPDGSIAHRLPQPEPVPTVAYGRIHHDVIATPANTLLFIANDTRTIGTEQVVGEALWEWTPETGAVVKRWSAFDHLDWNVLRGARTEAGNWLHGNGISYGPRGNVVMSLRNVDQVLSISPDFKRVEWSLGGTNGTLAVASEDRFSGQHYVSEPLLNHILVYDNGFNRPGTPYTRAIEYVVDPERHTATRVWQYRHSPDIFASLVGSTQRLSNGNTVVLFGMLAGQNNSTGPITAVEVSPGGTVQWRLSFGPQLTRLYRLTPVSSLQGERPGRFRTM